MLIDRILGRKVRRDKYNFPIALNRKGNTKQDVVNKQVKEILSGEDQKIILMARG